MDIYTHLDIYNISYNTCVLHTTAIWQLSLSVHSQQRLLPAKSQCWSTTDLFSTNSRDLVLWKCSYGPWDHFMFSANTSILLAKRYKTKTKNPRLQLMYRCKVPSCGTWQKAFTCSRKAFIFWRKAFIFLRKADPPLFAAIRRYSTLIRR